MSDDKICSKCKFSKPHYTDFGVRVRNIVRCTYWHYYYSPSNTCNLFTEKEAERLIDADNLQFGWCGSEMCGKLCDNCNKRTISKEDVDNAPTVEQSYQAPKDYIRNKLDYSRPQGEWGRWIIYTIKCPECLECFNFPTEHYSMEFLKECPNCGARMMREAENDK